MSKSGNILLCGVNADRRRATQKSPPRPLILWRQAPTGTHSVVPPLCEQSEFADPLTFPSINGCSLYVIWPARLIEGKLHPFSTFGREQ
jgi:hypothetical protein